MSVVVWGLWGQCCKSVLRICKIFASVWLSTLISQFKSIYLFWISQKQPVWFFYVQYKMFFSGEFCHLTLGSSFFCFCLVIFKMVLKSGTYVNMHICTANYCLQQMYWHQPCNEITLCNCSHCKNNISDLPGIPLILWEPDLWSFR